VTLIDAPHDWAIGDLPSSGATPSSKWYYDVGRGHRVHQRRRVVRTARSSRLPTRSHRTDHCGSHGPAKLAGHRSDITDTSFEIRYASRSRRREGRGVRRRLVSPQMVWRKEVTRDTPVTTSALTDVGPLWPSVPLGPHERGSHGCNALRDVGRCREFQCRA